MSNQSDRIAVYTGSFDPITLGHLNVIERAASLVDRLVVGIGINVEKQAMFPPDQRIELVRAATSGIAGVEVKSFEGLAVKFVRDCGARVMVRGIRPLTDIAAEFTMMLANRELDADVETIFLMADQSLAHVSSTLIKQIAPLATDEMLGRFVPPIIIPALRENRRLMRFSGKPGLSHSHSRPLPIRRFPPDLLLPKEQEWRIIPRGSTTVRTAARAQQRIRATVVHALKTCITDGA